MTDEFWIVRDDCGIKTFPRAGSTTILQTYGYGQSYERWLKAPRQFVVVRNPWERLLSAYQLFQNKRYGDVPKLGTLDDLLDYIIERDQKDCDAHVRSQFTQLEGAPITKEMLVEMNYFLANPPIKIRASHRHLWCNRTGRRADEMFTISKYEKWKRIYWADFELFDSAKKAPKEGGERRLS